MIALLDRVWIEFTVGRRRKRCKALNLCGRFIMADKTWRGLCPRYRDMHPRRTCWALHSAPISCRGEQLASKPPKDVRAPRGRTGQRRSLCITKETSQSRRASAAFSANRIRLTATARATATCDLAISGGMRRGRSSCAARGSQWSGDGTADMLAPYQIVVCSVASDPEPDQVVAVAH